MIFDTYKSSYFLCWFFIQKAFTHIHIVLVLSIFSARYVLDGTSYCFINGNRREAKMSLCIITSDSYLHYRSQQASHKWPNRGWRRVGIGRQRNQLRNKYARVSQMRTVARKKGDAKQEERRATRRSSFSGEPTERLLLVGTSVLYHANDILHRFPLYSQRHLVHLRVTTEVDVGKDGWYGMMRCDV